mmetsp:Transcript_53758/g.172317  ORF Transcript_53758/g.172317 Transcript_53758/m.172317 type:complete len:289 (+) Transcript_53758:643-1509(+)
MWTSRCPGPRPSTSRPWWRSLPCSTRSSPWKCHGSCVRSSAWSRPARSTGRCPRRCRWCSCEARSASSKCPQCCAPSGLWRCPPPSMSTRSQRSRVRRYITCPSACPGLWLRCPLHRAPTCPRRTSACPGAHRWPPMSPTRSRCPSVLRSACHGALRCLRPRHLPRSAWTRSRSPSATCSAARGARQGPRPRHLPRSAWTSSRGPPPPRSASRRRKELQPRRPLRLAETCSGRRPPQRGASRRAHQGPRHRPCDHQQLRHRRWTLCCQRGRRRRGPWCRQRRCHRRRP